MIIFKHTPGPPEHDHVWAVETAHIMYRTAAAEASEGEDYPPWRAGDHVAVLPEPIKIKRCACGAWGWG